MPHRLPLINLLNAYTPSDSGQIAAKAQIMSFAEKHEDCFSRNNLAGHITGSCFLVDPEGREILLTHHKKIGSWLQLGGHADDDPNILRVALREACEESGIDGIEVVTPQIFDVDIHLINAHIGVPEHFHYDVRFILRAPHKNTHISDESNDLCWRSIETIATDPSFDESLRRMARKWLSLSMHGA